MDTLVAKIQELSAMHSVEKDYNWDIRSHPPHAPQSLIDILDDSKISRFDKSVYLKTTLKDTLKNDKSLEIHYWIIQKWGGIYAFKRNTRNDERINNLKSDLDNERLSFGCIASLSKVASFMAPETYAIYDSRAIYTLNWLLFKFADGKKLFPQPVGRNAKLTKHNIEKKFPSTDKAPEYYPKNEAFHEYCKLMKQLTFMQHGREKPLYLLEMLLFMIAPTWVIQDMVSTSP